MIRNKYYEEIQELMKVGIDFDKIVDEKKTNININVNLLEINKSINTKDNIIYNMYLNNNLDLENIVNTEDISFEDYEKKKNILIKELIQNNEENNWHSQLNIIIKQNQNYIFNNLFLQLNNRFSYIYKMLLIMNIFNRNDPKRVNKNIDYEYLFSKKGIGDISINKIIYTLA